MNSIDIIILIILALFCIKGFFRGFILEIFTLIGLLLAYVIALREMNTMAVLISNLLHLPTPITNMLSFVSIFLLVVLVCRLLAGAIRKFTRWTFIGWIDRGGGTLFGLFKGALIASLIALLFSLVPISEELETEKNDSFLFRPIRTVAPAVFNFIKHTFPRTKDFYLEISEGFKNKSKEVVDHVLSERLESLQQDLKNRVK